MRLFIAIELPAPVIAAADALSHLLRERVSRAAPDARLTWIPVDRMHVTIRFLGEVPAERAAIIADVLARPLHSPVFSVSAGEAGVFPGRGTPRVLWVALAGAAAPLQGVASEVSGRLETVGIPREPRPFSPHVTLARVRQPDGLRTSILTGLAAPAHAGGGVDAITLFESRLSPKGAAYTALQRTPLRRG
jgi:2'-5' RNA ligase